MPPLFAETDVVAWTVTVLTLLGGGVVWLWNIITAKSKDDYRRMEEYADKLLSRLDQREALNEEQQRAVETLWRMLADRIGNANEQRQCAVQNRRIVLQLTAILKSHNLSTDGWEPIELPPPPSSTTEAEAEFELRTTQHSAALLRDTTRPKPPTAQPGPGGQP